MRTLIVALVLLLLPSAAEAKGSRRSGGSDRGRRAARHAGAGAAQASVKGRLRAVKKLLARKAWAKAAGELEAVRRIAPEPGVDYDLGRCYDSLGRTAEAVAAYERFLASSPKPAVAKRIESRVAVLRGRAAAASAVPPAPGPAADGRTRSFPGAGSAVLPPSVAPPPAPVARAPAATGPSSPAASGSGGGRPLLRAGIGLLVSGAVIAVAGGVAFGLLAEEQGSRILDQSRRGAPYDPSLQEAGLLYQNLSFATLGIGGALAVTGAVLVGVGASRERARPAPQALRARPLVGPAQAGLLLDGRF